MKLYIHSLTVTLLAGAALLAQEPPTRTTPTTPPPVTQDPRGAQSQTQSDSILATWLLVDSENEIAIARIGQQRATNPEVKQFAQKMIDDHGKIVQKLQPLASRGSARVGQAGTEPRRTPETGNTGNPPTGTPTTGTPPAGTPPETGRDPKGEYPAGTPRDASGVRAMGELDHERLVRDLGRQCLASATKALQEKQGAEFDRCFMGMQVGAHMKAVDHIEVFRTFASAALKPTLDEGLKTMQAHLQHAKDLAKRTDTTVASNTPAK